MNRQAADMLKVRTTREVAFLILEWLNTDSPSSADAESLLAEAVELLTTTKSVLFEIANIEDEAAKAAPSKADAEVKS